MKKTYGFLLGVFLLFLLFACKNRNITDNQTFDDQQAGDQIEEYDNIFYRFPSPDEMLNIIDRESIDFDDALPLNSEYANRYLDSRSQALNLGVYSADLAYITLMKRQKEVLSYFQVVYGLSEKLRISSAFEPTLMKRFENNIGNFDTLKILTDEAIVDINNYLSRNDKERIFVMISIGGFIESLYLAFNLVGDYSEGNSIIIQRISDQKLVLENLLGFAADYADDSNVSACIELINPVRAVYNELLVKQEETTVTKDVNGKLIIGGGEKIKITPDQFNKLREAIFDVRKSITEN